MYDLYVSAAVSIYSPTPTITGVPRGASCEPLSGSSVTDKILGRHSVGKRRIYYGRAAVRVGLEQAGGNRCSAIGREEPQLINLLGRQRRQIAGKENQAAIAPLINCLSAGLRLASCRHQFNLLRLGINQRGNDVIRLPGVGSAALQAEFPATQYDARTPSSVASRQSQPETTQAQRPSPKLPTTQITVVAPWSVAPPLISIPAGAAPSRSRSSTARGNAPAAWARSRSVQSQQDRRAALPVRAGRRHTSPDASRAQNARRRKACRARRAPRSSANCSCTLMRPTLSATTTGPCEFGS